MRTVLLDRRQVANPCDVALVEDAVIVRVALDAGHEFLVAVELEGFYPIYTEEEMQENPELRDTGLFFFRGQPGVPFAIVNAGGGFAYVGAIHESLPHALALSERGYNGFALIYGSSFFAALNNGLISALISFLRTFLFQVAAVLVFPLIWGIDGIWFSIVAAELLAMIVTILFLIGARSRYHY